MEARHEESAESSNQDEDLPPRDQIEEGHDEHSDSPSTQDDFESSPEAFLPQAGNSL